jgi:methionyl-tRNA formyltransferase
MKLETVFIGNESPYLEVLNKLSELSKVVCEPIRGASKKIFGSAYQFAKARKIEVVSPAVYIKNPEQADIIVVSGYSKLIPRKVIESSRIATVNIHQSLLPAYRGRHPLNWAIINGEAYTGVTIHHLSEGFDEGNIILQKKVKIFDNNTIMDLYWKTTEKGRELLPPLFRKAKKGDLTGFRQDPKLASYFPPRTPKDGKIDWTESAENVYNLIRALTYPYPGAYFYSHRKKMVIESAQPVREGPPRAKTGVPVFYKGACLVKTGLEFLKITQLRNRSLSEIKN